MSLGDFGSRSAAAIAAAAVVLIAGLIGVRIYTAEASDRQVADREELVVRNGLRGWAAETEAKVVGQTTWDDAVKRLGVSYDPVWAHKNIGVFLHEVSGFERTYILDGRDRPIYAMSFGADQPVTAYAPISGAAAGLIGRVRRLEAAFESRANRPESNARSMRRAIQASSFTIIDGVPNIVSATLVQPDFGRYQFAGPAPIVVTTEIMDAALLKRFGDRFLLSGLRVAARAGQSPAGAAAVNLVDDRGTWVTTLEWNPQTPGRHLLHRSLPAMLVAMLIFCAIVLGLFLRGRQVVSSLMASEVQSKHMAYHDVLTGLPNRAMYAQRMDIALADLRRTGREIGVLALDLDRFKLINDTYGHGSGDQLIIQVAARLQGLVRASDVVVRLGGDEFVALCFGETPAGLATLAQRIVDAMALPFEIFSGRVFSGASVGVTLITNPDTDGEEALRQADLAMYRAKDAGRGRYEFYEPEMDLALKARRALEHDLREALATDALYMVYQPQLDGQGKVEGVEALARWNHPVRGPVSPAFFVPIAEECGLIETLGEFTLRRAFRDSLLWPEVRVAINVSARQLRSGGFPDRVAALLEETGADARQLELEITEGVLLEDDMPTHKTLSRLRSMGFSLALDDFGTGYSSLAYLRRYPVDKIKIDRSFIVTLGVERESEAVVGAIVKLARALNLRVIAEGVETAEQRDSLRRVGCTDIQGFLFSQPLIAGEIAGFIDDSAREHARGRAPRRPFATN